MSLLLQGNSGRNDVQYVTDLRSADVLFGRGSGPNDHEGNVRFRQLVAERKAEYMATNHRMTKAKIAKDIVNQVFAENGRFLKKIDLPDGEVYELADEDTIMEKAKQALRQNAGKAKIEGDVPKAKPKLANSDDFHPVIPQPAAKPSYVEDLEPIPLRSSAAVAPPPPIASSGITSVPVQSLPAQGIPQWSDRGRNAKEAVQPDVRGYKQEDPAMLAYLRGSAMANVGVSNDVSMAQLPQEDRRISMTISDLQNHRGEMGELVDSFSKMKAVDDSRKAFTSTETMGTIEPIGTGSLADMSVGSTFSLFKTNDNISPGDDKIGAPSERQLRDDSAPPPGQQYMREGSNLTFPSAKFMQSEGSLSFMDFWSSRRKSSASSNLSVPQEGGAAEGRPSVVGFPRTLELMEEEPDNLGYEGMGHSSMSILKAAFTSTGNIDMPPPSEPPQHAEGESSTTFNSNNRDQRGSGASGTQYNVRDQY